MRVNEIQDLSNVLLDTLNTYQKEKIAKGEGLTKSEVNAACALFFVNVCNQTPEDPEEIISRMVKSWKSVVGSNTKTTSSTDSFITRWWRYLTS